MSSQIEVKINISIHWRKSISPYKETLSVPLAPSPVLPESKNHSRYLFTQAQRERARANNSIYHPSS